MPRQMPLIPVSEQEFTQASYDLAQLHQQDEEEDAAWDEAKKAHKENKAIIRKEMAERRALILRAKHERDEGLTAQQVDALLNQAREEEA